ncbi:MAG: glycosyltransferase [Thermoleophilia bacterium]
MSWVLGGMPKVLVIPSWYPSPEYPTSGIFILRQVEALADQVDVAVLYVREARRGLAPVVLVEDSHLVARVQLKMPPPSRTIPGRSRAVATNLHNKFVRYEREGLAAFEQLRATWGTPDIVHVQALWPAALLARAINRRYGIPYVVTEHSEEYLAASRRRMVRTPGVVPLVLRPLARGGERTIAVSGHLAQRLGELGLAVRPIVIPNVVPTYESAPRPQGGRRGIAHVSVMGPAKNLRSLLRAAERLRHRRIDFVVRLVGDGESRAELERMAAALELTGTFVEFVGRLDAAAVREQFAAASFTVVCSTHETFSVVAAESLMCGRPVLSTRCGGPEEFIDDTVGRLIPVDDVEALVEGLDWMLDHADEFDPRALHDYAAARFAPEVVARQITAVYEEALRDR